MMFSLSWIPKKGIFRLSKPASLEINDTVYKRCYTISYNWSAQYHHKLYFDTLISKHFPVAMSVLCWNAPLAGALGTIWGCNVAMLQCCMCFHRDPNYLQPILNPGGICHCILAAAQYCSLIKKIWLCCRILNPQDCPKRISPARSVNYDKSFLL